MRFVWTLFLLGLLIPASARAASAERGRAPLEREAFRRIRCLSPEGVLPARDLVTIVGNLLDNAIDAAAAAPGPRRVSFSGWVEDAASGPSGHGIASTLVLQVSDTGPGLDEASATSAFTRGWSTKLNGKPNARLVGRGLGLALVGQAAHRHHGTVEVGRADAAFVEAGPAEAGSVDVVKTVFAGAVFTVRLPLAIEVAP